MIIQFLEIGFSIVCSSCDNSFFLFLWDSRRFYRFSFICLFFFFFSFLLVLFVSSLLTLIEMTIKLNYRRFFWTFPSLTWNIHQDLSGFCFCFVPYPSPFFSLVNFFIFLFLLLLLLRFYSDSFVSVMIFLEILPAVPGSYVSPGLFEILPSLFLI